MHATARIDLLVGGGERITVVRDATELSAFVTKSFNELKVANEAICAVRSLDGCTAAMVAVRNQSRSLMSRGRPRVP